MSAVTFTFSSAMELMAIEQTLLPTLTQDNPAFDILPDINKDVPMVMFEQLDNFLGMMQPRGYNGKPNLVKAVGSKWFQYQPGVYGEHMTIEEREVTISRRFGTVNAPIDVTDLTTQRGNQLLHRQLKRRIWLTWQLLAAGYYVATDPYGVIMHADSYTQRIYTATTSWSTVASATPLADLRAIRPYARGYSVSFGNKATGYANNTTIRNLLNNANSADLHGRRMEVGATFNSLADINKVLVANDCPRIVEWDGIWQDDTGANQLDIPDNTVIIKGVRLDGAPVGNMISTRNANNPGFAAGPYYEVFQPFQAVPPTVEIHRGVNMGPALYFPSAVVVMKV